MVFCTTYTKPLSPWEVVKRRLFGGQAPGAKAFSQKHGLVEAEVRKLFSGEIITFSLEVCAALNQETEMSKAFFRNLSNRWWPAPPPAVSAALETGPPIFCYGTWNDVGTYVDTS